MSQATPGRKTTPAARPYGITESKVNTPPRHVVHRPGALDYQKHPSRIGDRLVPYHVQDEQP